MFRRWKWFRRRRRSASAQRAAASALREDRIVREALDDYVRDAFSPPAPPTPTPTPTPTATSVAAARARCSVRRLPVDSAPRGLGRWSLDDQLLFGGRRRSYTVLYLSTSPTASSKAGQQGAEADESGAAFSCDCSEQSSCPHASGRQMVDASTQAPIPKKPFTPWKSQKKSEESLPKQQKGTNEQGIQVDRSEFVISKSSQTRTPSTHVTLVEDTEEPIAPSATSVVSESEQVEVVTQREDQPPQQKEVRAVPGPSAAETPVVSEPRKVEKVTQTEDQPPEQEVVRAAPGPSAEEAPVLWESKQLVQVTQTEEQPVQQTVVRLLPGPSGMPTIVIETAGNVTYASQSEPRSADAAVQVRTEQLEAAGEAARAGRPAERERKGRPAGDRQAGRARPQRPRLDAAKSARAAQRHAEEAPPPPPTPSAEPAPDDGDRSPGSMRWSEWDDKQSPWAAAEKYPIRRTNEESQQTIDSAPRSSSSLQFFDSRIAEEGECLAAPACAPCLVLTEQPASTAAVAAAAAAAAVAATNAAAASGGREPEASTPARARRRCPSAAAPGASSPAPATCPGALPAVLYRPNLKRHDCTGQLHDPPGCPGQRPK